MVFGVRENTLSKAEPVYGNLDVNGCQTGPLKDLKVSEFFEVGIAVVVDFRDTRA